MTEPKYSHNDVLHTTESANSSGSINQSSPAKKLRRKASHLPAIQTKPGPYKSRSACSVVESLTLANGSEHLSENWPCEVPQSAPPVMTAEPVFVWPSPKRNPQDAVFYDWPNATATISNHQDGDCSIRMPSGNKQGRNERSSYPYPEEFKAQSSADGATTRRTDDQIKWSRKPPHHLPPLDPSLFKTKNKTTKAVSSREKKNKRCVNRPIEVDSSNEVSSENDSGKGANKKDDGFYSPPEKYELSDKHSLVTSLSINQNSCPTYEGVRVTSSRTRRGENPIVPFQATPAIHKELQQAAGTATGEIHVVGEFPRCVPQPGPSPSNSCAYWRVRKSGVCSQVQSVAEEKERTQARVLMKKFGTLDIQKN